MHTTAPVISTSRLNLRPFNNDDSGRLHEILSEEGVLRYFPRTQPPLLEAVCREVAFQIQHWQTYGYGRWVIDRLAGPTMMGWCGLQYIPDTKEIEIGYLLGRSFWGNGFATEAARAGVKWGFENLPLETLIAIVHPENVASQRVAEKLGMTFSNRDRYFGMDCFRYVIGRSEFEGLRKSVDEIGGT